MESLVQTIYAFGMVFFACEFSQQISDAFEETNDVIGQFCWYLFPTEVLRIYPTTIAFVQQPVHIESFGRRSCDRDSFKVVSLLKNVLSNYYMSTFIRYYKFIEHF